MKTEHIRIVQRILDDLFVATAAQDGIHQHAQAMREQLNALAENPTIDNVISLLKIAAHARLDASTDQKVRDIFAAIHIYLWEILSTAPSTFAKTLTQARANTERNLRLVGRQQKNTLSPQRPNTPASKEMQEWQLKQAQLKKNIAELEVMLSALTPPTTRQRDSNIDFIVSDLMQNTTTAFTAIINPPHSASSSSESHQPLYDKIESIPAIPQHYIAVLKQEFISALEKNNVDGPIIELIGQDFDLLGTNPSLKNWNALVIHLTYTQSENSVHNQMLERLYGILDESIKNPPVIEAQQTTAPTLQIESKKRKGLFDFSSNKKTKTEITNDDSAAIERWRQKIKAKITKPRTLIGEVKETLHPNITERAKTKRLSTPR